MNYEGIILELLSRVQNLETAVKELQNIAGKPTNGIGTEKDCEYIKTDRISGQVKVDAEQPSLIKTAQVYDYIQSKKDEAKKEGQEFLILRAGEIGKHFGANNRLQVILNAMQKAMGSDDISSGSATMYEVRYYLQQKTAGKNMKGTLNNFIISKGISPQNEFGIREIKVYEGREYLMVYDCYDRCVGVVYKHNENRQVSANGQAEICFFDKYYNELGKWHRMFYGGYQGGERIRYDDLLEEIEKKGVFSYSGYIRP